MFMETTSTVGPSKHQGLGMITVFITDPLAVTVLHSGMAVTPAML